MRWHLVAAAAFIAPVWAQADQELTQEQLEAIATSVENQQVRVGETEEAMSVDTPSDTSGSVQVGTDRKCYDWAWQGGANGPVGAHVKGDLCLIATARQGMPLEQMRTEVKGEANIGARIVQKELDVLHAQFSGVAPMVGTPTASASVEVMGNTVWSKSASAPSLQWQEGYELLQFDQNVPYTFMVGPFPATVKIGAHGTGRLDVGATINIANVNARATPRVDVAGYADGTLAVGPLTGSLVAKATLIRDTLKLVGNAGLTLDPLSSPARVLFAAEALGINSLSALSGELSLVARSMIPIPRIGREFTYPLFRFNGYEVQHEIFHERIEPTPVVHAFR